MARLPERGETYLSTVRGMCRACRRIVPARVFLREGRVFQESLCPDHPGASALIAEDGHWYLGNVLGAPGPDRSPLKGARPSAKGCPHDCGPCAWHATPCQLPVVSVTNACELECPICFTYNRNDRVWYMQRSEMRRTVDALLEAAGSVDLINITGGEPTMHPDLLGILDECRRPGIGRVTMNSNGVRLAADPDLCARLAERNVCVILSLHTLDPATSVRIHGRDLVASKLRALDNLERAGVRVTILNVLVRGENERELGAFFEMLRTRPSVLSLTIQTMTYTGQGGGRFPDRRQIPADEAARLVSEGSRGALDASDFLPRPSAHPLCYAVAYLLKSGDGLVPFTRFADRAQISERLADSYLIRLGPADDFLRRAIDAAFARGETALLAPFRSLLERLYPRGRVLSDFERQRVAEESVRTVYVHAHMDEDTFDCARAMRCPDQVPAADGTFVPACTYNLFYRMKDERFYP
ncbi:MAG: radical SAM protein [Planctomycetota bacterium]